MADPASEPVAKIDAEIAQLRAALAALASMPQLQPPLQAQLDARERERAGLIAAAAQQSGGVNLSGAQIDSMGDVVGRDKITHQYFGTPEAALSAETLLRAYLGDLVSEVNHLTLTEAGNANPEQAEVLLEDIYTRLEVASEFPLGEREARGQEMRLRESQRQATALEALSHHGRLVLIGPPGSGKSTLTRFLTLCLARVALGGASWRARLGEEWPTGRLLPIRIELSALATWLAAHEEAGGAAALWAYLAESAQQPALAALLQEATRRGETLVILDGLDEVPRGDQSALLHRVRRVIEALTTTAEPRLVLVTCRVLDYDEPERRLMGWPVETLIPFSDELQQAFIASWYATLQQRGRTVGGSYAVLREKLQRAVRERQDLRRLAGNPLLLTMMALVHASRGELPEKRAHLYRECLDLLLNRWRRTRDRPSLEQSLGIPWVQDDTDRLLNHLAFAAHSQEPDTDDQEAREAGATLTRYALIQTSERVFALYRHPNSFGLAEKFCAYVSAHSNGVLQCHGPDAYRFPHRTFQEYLAARRLTDDRDWEPDEAGLVNRLLTRATSAQWHEVLLLSVSQLVLNTRAGDLALLIQLLLKPKRGTRAWAQGAVVAGELLAETGRTHLDGVRQGELWDQVLDALVTLLTPPTTSGRPARSTLDAAWRVRAGAALGRMGDPRPGVCTLAPDWCVVPAGPFLMGSRDDEPDSYDDEKPQHMVDLPAYQISRYPVTNAQWQRFIDAGGYQERRWWSEAGWAARQQRGWELPEEWDNPRFGLPNQPVVGISWYEANAYCRWLSAELGYEVRLPSEAEWEKAARGTDGRIYPWGDAWHEGWANVGERSLDATAPVGCYPNDRSQLCGMLDVVGNLGEWTATPGSESYETGDVTLADSEGTAALFANRGGAWSDNQWGARCAWRSLIHPSIRSSDLGVRVFGERVTSDE